MLVLFLDLIGSSGFIFFQFLLKKQLSSKFQFDIEHTNTFCINEILPSTLRCSMSEKTTVNCSPYTDLMFLQAVTDGWLLFLH